MKFLRVGERGNEIPAILDDKNNIRNLSNIFKDLTPENLNFENLDKIKNFDINSLPLLDQNQRIGSCVIKPANFFAIGLNDDIVIPKFSKSLDHEVEIAIVIGKKAKYVKEEEAQDYIIGYCICNDISEREWQKDRGGQWVKGKSGDTFGPLGPYLVTKDEIRDPSNLN